MTRTLIAAAALLVCCPAAADDVYRCEKDGKITFTDRPCNKEAQPVDLPDAVVISKPTKAERDLAKQHDARISRAKQSRGDSDAEWVKNHEGRKKHQDRVRTAIIERRVVNGMTADEVRQALGEPDDITRSESHGSDKETWTYAGGEGGSRKVNFKQGEVSSTSSGSKKKKK